MRKLLPVVVLAASLVFAGSPSPVSASTVFLDEPFGAGWTTGTDWIVATGSTFPPAVVSVGGQTPTNALRLTPATNNQSSALIFARPQPTSQGLDVSFRQSQWGGTDADGLTFFLQKGTVTSSASGSLGGALGYSAEPGVSRTGLPGGLLGIGLDLYGSFADNTFGGTDCTEINPGRQAKSLVIRGPGNGLVGYCRLAYVTSSATADPIDWSNGGNDRTSRARSIRIVVDPSTASTPQVKVWVCAVGTRCNTSSTPTLAVNAPTELLAEPTVRFGFSAGTGGQNNNHEIWDLQVASFQTFPAAAIATTALGDATFEAAFSTTIAASGVTPLTYAVSAGSLPPGLSLSPTTGAITGVPTQTGVSTFTITVTDSRAPSEPGRTASQTYSLRVGVPGPVVNAIRVDLDPRGGTCRVDKTKLTEPTRYVYLGYAYVPGPTDCTRPGHRLVGWAERAKPTELANLPLLFDPVDRVERFFVARNIDLLALWQEAPTELDDFTGTPGGTFVGGVDRRTREGGGVVDGYYIPPGTRFEKLMPRR